MESGTEQILGDSEGQGSLCCNPWGCRVRHDSATEQQELRLARGGQGTGEGFRCGARVPSHQKKGKESIGSGGFAGSVTGA